LRKDKKSGQVTLTYIDDFLPEKMGAEEGGREKEKCGGQKSKNNFFSQIPFPAKFSSEKNSRYLRAQVGHYFCL
jgi:hypothetical protein